MKLDADEAQRRHMQIAKVCAGLSYQDTCALLCASLAAFLDGAAPDAAMYLADLAQGYFAKYRTDLAGKCH